MTNELDKITEIVRRILNLNDVHTVWEIGSRDGKDATRLSRTFPCAEIHAFEPNPDTFHLVAEQAAKSNGKR